MCSLRSAFAIALFGGPARFLSLERAFPAALRCIWEHVSAVVLAHGWLTVFLLLCFLLLLSRRSRHSVDRPTAIPKTFRSPNLRKLHELPGRRRHPDLEI